MPSNSEEMIEKNFQLLKLQINSAPELLELCWENDILPEIYRVSMGAKLTSTDRNALLLNLCVQDKKGRELGSALYRTEQEHLVQYVMTDGDFGEKFLVALPCILFVMLLLLL